MPYFIVNRNAQSNGDHEVHNTTTGCSFMPNAANQLDLGYHASCHGAVQKAKETYWQSNGCYWCCPECNTG
jgi:hypothetical protein